MKWKKYCFRGHLSLSEDFICEEFIRKEGLTWRGQDYEKQNNVISIFISPFGGGLMSAESANLLFLKFY